MPQIKTLGCLKCAVYASLEARGDLLSAYAGKRLRVSCKKSRHRMPFAFQDGIAG